MGRLTTTRPRWLFGALLFCILFAGALLRATWREQLVDRGIGGDGLQYWWIATHIEKEHVLSLDGKTPEWTRLPGYPALLAVTTSPAISAEGPQDPLSIKLRVDAWLRRLTLVNLATDLLAALATTLLALFLDAGMMALVGALAWSILPWSSVVAIHPLSDALATTMTAFFLVALGRGVRDGRARDFALAGALAAVCLYVRGDGVFLVPVLVVGALLRRGRWPERLRLGAIAVTTFALVYAPWPIRNLMVFGEPHTLGGAAGIDGKGQPLDRTAAFEWMRTWSVADEPAVVGVAWRFPSLPLAITDVPAAAFDSPAERAEVAAILDAYNKNGARLDAANTARLDAVTREKRRHHPLRYWLRLPLQRVVRRLFPPRDRYGMGTLPTLAAARTAWSILDGTLVVCGLLGLLLAARRSPVARLFGLWLLLRLALMAWLPMPEPRYFLQALPLIYAGAAALFALLYREAHRRGFRLFSA